MPSFTVTNLLLQWEKQPDFTKVFRKIDIYFKCLVCRLRRLIPNPQNCSDKWLLILAHVRTMHFCNFPVPGEAIKH